MKLINRFSLLVTTCIALNACAYFDTSAWQSTGASNNGQQASQRVNTAPSGYDMNDVQSAIYHSTKGGVQIYSFDQPVVSMDSVSMQAQNAQQPLYASTKDMPRDMSAQEIGAPQTARPGGYQLPATRKDNAQIQTKDPSVEVYGFEQDRNLPKATELLRLNNGGVSDMATSSQEIMPPARDKVLSYQQTGAPIQLKSPADFK